jgi:serine/threonine-protein kinase
MGVVYRGTDPALDRTVAIKVIRVGVADSSVPPEEMEARFLREAKVAARISHPNVVTVFDAGREGHALFIVMELIDGESLASRMARGSFPSSSEALEITARVADALAAAHAMGVIHRDIKPANIMLTRDGGVKVADFGVAKAIGEGTDLTRTGTVVGSPAYMAPEQVRGEPIDGRSDLFSLGVVLYEMIMRRKPFPADTVTTLIYQILNDDPFKDPSLTAPLGQEMIGFLRQCLAKNPSERVANAAAFAAGARAVLASQTAASVEATGPTRILTTPVLEPAAPEAEQPPTAQLPAQKTLASPPARPAPPTGKPPVRKAQWVPLAVLGGGLVAVVAAVVMLLRPPSTEPPAGETLIAAGPTPMVMEAQPPADVRATQAPAVSSSPGYGLTMVTPAPSVTTVPPGTPAAGAGIVAATPAAADEAVTIEPTPTPTLAAVFVCSKGAEFNVSPEEAEITINGRAIGIADDWDGMGGGKTYEFSAPGSYYVMLTAKGYATTWLKIEVRPGAEDEIADVDTELSEASSKKKDEKAKKDE